MDFLLQLLFILKLCWSSVFFTHVLGYVYPLETKLGVFGHC